MFPLHGTIFDHGSLLPIELSYGIDLEDLWHAHSVHLESGAAAKRPGDEPLRGRRWGTGNVPGHAVVNSVVLSVVMSVVLSIVLLVMV